MLIVTAEETTATRTDRTINFFFILDFLFETNRKTRTTAFIKGTQNNKESSVDFKSHVTYIQKPFDFSSL